MSSDARSTDEGAVRQAADRWARTVFGAPRAFSNSITGVEARDEVIERVATEVVRRDLRITYAPTSRGEITTPEVDWSTVDPFAYSEPSLRQATEHVIRCAPC